jgi:hypothetical protein
MNCAVGAVDNRQTGFNIQRQPLLAVVELRFAAQRVGDAVGGVDIGHQQEALAGCSNHSRLVAPSLTTGLAASGRARTAAPARRAPGTGHPQQNQIVVGGDGDFGEIFFQFGQLRVAQAAALNPRVAAEYAQVAPHLAFGTVRQADADRSHRR